MPLRFFVLDIAPIVCSALFGARSREDSPSLPRAASHARISLRTKRFSHARFISRSAVLNP